MTFRNPVRVRLIGPALLLARFVVEFKAPASKKAMLLESVPRYYRPLGIPKRVT